MQNNKKLVDLEEFKIFCFENDWSGRDVINGKLWEPHILQTILLLSKIDNGCFVDCGSNYGWHSIYASKIFQSVLSFEPQKLLFETQLDSISVNNITNILLFHDALGDKAATVYLPELDYSRDMHMGDTSLSRSATSIGINQRTLNDIECRTSVIKIDVQGYEKFILDGASNHLNTNKPFIIVEIEEHQLRRFDVKLNEVFDILHNYGHIYFIDYFYPSDFLVVPYERESEFTNRFNPYIIDMEQNNNLNRCMDFGVTKRVKFSDDISLNRVKRISYETS